MNVMTAIKTRRSVRHYADKPIEEEKLHLVLEAGRLAPSAHNLQDWRFIVVRDPEMKRQLASAANAQRFVGEAAAVIAACALNPERVMSCGEKSYPIDLAIAIDHMTLKAVEEGLGTCWIGAFQQDQVKKLLHIPDNVRVVELLTIGYPTHNPKPTARKTFNEVVTFEKW